MVQSEGICIVWLEKWLARLPAASCGGEKLELGVTGIKSLTSLFLLPQFGGERGEYNQLSV